MEFNCYEKRLIEEKYIACYATLDDELENMMPILKALHEKNKCKFVLFGMVTPRKEEWIENIVAAGPFEFIRIIRDAELLITHSFHGTAFALNFNTPFLTYNDEYENPRKEGILQMFGLTKRIVHSVCELEDALCSKIDFNQVNTVLQEERKKTEKEIRRCLGEV